MAPIKKTNSNKVDQKTSLFNFIHVLRNLSSEGVLKNLQSIKEIIGTLQNVNLRSQNGTPILVALIRFYKIDKNKESFLSIIELLLEKNVDINAKDTSYGYVEVPCNNTALFESIFRENLEVAEMLIKWGADLDIGSYENKTPLIEAVILNQRKIVELLIKHGANINLKTNRNDTALDIALNIQKNPNNWFLPDMDRKDPKIIKENEKIIDLLIESGGKKKIFNLF